MESIQTEIARLSNRTGVQKKERTSSTWSALGRPLPDEPHGLLLALRTFAAGFPNGADDGKIPFRNQSFGELVGQGASGAERSDFLAHFAGYAGGTRSLA